MQIPQPAKATKRKNKRTEKGAVNSLRISGVISDFFLVVLDMSEKLLLGRRLKRRNQGVAEEEQSKSRKPIRRAQFLKSFS